MRLHDPNRPRVRGEHWLIVAGAAAVLLGLVAMRLVLTPAPEGFGTHEQLGLPPCRSVDWFGIPCPGCGVTTAVTWFVYGDLARSFAAQPLGFVLAFGGTLALPLALAATALGHDLAELARRLDWRRLFPPALAVAAAAWLYKIVTML